MVWQGKMCGTKCHLNYEGKITSLKPTPVMVSWWYWTWNLSRCKCRDTTFVTSMLRHIKKRFYIGKWMRNYLPHHSWKSILKKSILNKTKKIGDIGFFNTLKISCLVLNFRVRKQTWILDLEFPEIGDAKWMDLGFFLK